MRASHIPMRLATGAFILNSGLSHLSMDEDQAKQLHGMAVGAYPLLERLEPKLFGQILAGGEVALGAAMLVPVVPSGVAGLALGGFSGSLLGMYARTPGVHEEGSLRPTGQGIALAKDSWMAGIAMALVVDHFASNRAKRRRRRTQERMTEHHRRLEAERHSLEEALSAQREQTRKATRKAKRGRLARGAEVGSTLARAAGESGPGKRARQVGALAGAATK